MILKNAKIQANITDKLLVIKSILVFTLLRAETLTIIEIT